MSSARALTHGSVQRLTLGHALVAHPGRDATWSGSCSTTRPGPPSSSGPSWRARTTYYLRRVSPDRRRRPSATPGFPPPERDAYIQTIGVSKSAQRRRDRPPADAAPCWPRRSAGEALSCWLEVRADNAPAQSLYSPARLRRPRACASGYYQPSGTDALVMAVALPLPEQPCMTTVLGFETSCDETGIGIVRDGELLADALATSDRGARALRRRRTRGRGTGPRRGDGADGPPRARDGGGEAGRDRRGRGHGGPGARRPADGRGRRGQGLRPRARGADLRGPPPRRPRRGRHPRSPGRCPKHASRCWSPVGTPRCSRVGRSRAPGDRDARLHRRRRGRRGVRQGRPAAGHGLSRVGRKSTVAAAGWQRQHRLPARARRPTARSTSPSAA